MSHICMLFIHKSNSQNYSVIENEIKRIVDKHGMGFFVEEKCDEPFVDKSSLYLVFSLSDNYEFDNCEMFLLPDGWICNGKSNKIPFINRMEVIQDCVIKLSKLKCQIEIFLGESGCQITDFIHLKCFPNEIANLINNNYCDKYGGEYNLHITLYSS